MTTEITAGDFVRSTRGHDKDQIFIVVCREGSFLYLANGKQRKSSKPKRKNVKHAVYEGSAGVSIAARLSSGDKLSNSEIRKAISDKDRKKTDEPGR